MSRQRDDMQTVAAGLFMTRLVRLIEVVIVSFTVYKIAALFAS